MEERKILKALKRTTATRKREERERVLGAVCLINPFRTARSFRFVQFNVVLCLYSHSTAPSLPDARKSIMHLWREEKLSVVRPRFEKKAHFIWATFIGIIY